MKYYTDEELIQRVENYGEELVNSTWLADKIRERFEQKDKQREYIARRCDVAAEHIGHNIISEILADRGH